ncbi:hypothetical protein ARMGADRAFT_1075552 [Armillaria gallica]|uniref:Uncharacterized protein n=1 Tax=Armillaria gallica TaxID=47427 RepID=A0A2H3DXZ4_ARMGA|nr:hypothetical protein ARMGADRAFT_1075552 [Armillaria gallica]
MGRANGIGKDAEFLLHAIGKGVFSDKTRDVLPGYLGGAHIFSLYSIKMYETKSSSIFPQHLKVAEKLIVDRVLFTVGYRVCSTAFGGKAPQITVNGPPATIYLRETLRLGVNAVLARPSPEATVDANAAS